ncbi:AAA family ATPase [Bradyrhizobium manausense]|uniref:AAA family ATPase n=1 Tax=Bradyrhizobium manausense TaxID=989370 RepID=UPI001BA897FD|nr:AAA family ATPase [Bradyrhizobium manausense]MBR0792692.1 AAA family ATPase [Bradyrhizobium manausense]
MGIAHDSAERAVREAARGWGFESGVTRIAVKPYLFIGRGASLCSANADRSRSIALAARVLAARLALWLQCGAKMILQKFRVLNFRSIENSGDIDVEKITALVGRNESGKSNLLTALASLNPAGGRKDLNSVKDFPRSKRIEECKPNTHVVWTWWGLNEKESEQLKDLLGSAPEDITIGRGYAAAQFWVNVNAKQPEIDAKKAASTIKRLKPVVEPKWAALDDALKTPCNLAWQALEQALTNGNAKAWSAAVIAATANLRSSLGAAGVMLDEAQDELLNQLEYPANAIANFDSKRRKAEELVEAWLPRFVYVSDFPELHGYQDLESFTQRRGQDPSSKERENNFEKLAKVAGFDPANLNANRNNHELRGQILNRASSLVTGEIRRLWKDRRLMVRFDIDGQHVTILVSDPNAQYPVEVNLDERSRGFRWFFAFYITFSADTQGGNSDGAILLLDEPGLYLHAKSQEHLLLHLRKDYDNQIIYTTHSPFMIPADSIDVVRTVNIDENNASGTTVTKTPTGDSRTLFPLQAALGYQLSQTLFVGHSNLIVEGVTDFWILSAVNAHLQTIDEPALPDELTITPAGGAGKVSYLAALLASEELNVLVLLDDDRAGRETQKDLVANKLLRNTAVLFVTDAFTPKPSEADIEDLIEPSVYEKLVKDTYKAELKGKTLALNSNIPRIVKRYEEAFVAAGLEFHKTRPAREFLARMGVDPNTVLSAASKGRFVAMFDAVRKRYDKIKDRAPFT